MKIPQPSRREQIALFRLSVVGDLVNQQLDRGELQEELRARASRRYRPPGAETTRTYGYSTLQRWYYEAKSNLVEGLVPKSRARGFARQLDDDQRQLLIDIRKEHPSAAADLVLSEARANGIVSDDALTVSTLRRLYRAAGVPRVSKRQADRSEDVQRRRWQAKDPGDIWHGDVCHLIHTDPSGRKRRVLVHGMIDDASRYCVALMPKYQEREQDMLEVLCGALLRHPAPKMLYLDQGSCYRGQVLELVCKRLGIRLVHAKPYSPQARGKMERFWRTMRQRCTDHLPQAADAHQTGQALWAWLDTDYQRRPHAALLGKTPRQCYLDAMGQLRAPLKPEQLAQALEVELFRQVRKDCTIELLGQTYEVAGRHLAGKRITLTIDGLTQSPLRAVWQDQQVRFGPCDPVNNRQRTRDSKGIQIGGAGGKEKAPAGPFDPIATLLQKARTGAKS
jgi:transposase InsO family protein